jgi:hypothetical protein
VDAKDFSARVSFKEIKEGKKHEIQSTLFDHAEQTVKFNAKDLNNAQVPPREKSAARQEGSLDLISAFYFVRLQKLKEGQLIRFPVNEGGVNYWFEIVVGKHEKLKTDCGKVKTIRLEPKLFGGKFFSKPGEMTMWVSDDNKHVPLKLLAKTPSGTVNAKLLNFKNNCKLIDDEGEQKPSGNGLEKTDDKPNKPTKSVVLPQSEAKRLAHLCSRSSPPEFSETWQPSETDIKTMESKFSLIKQLKAECCIKVKQVLNLDDYYLQYIGIVANGRRLIYINAFGNGHPPEDWKQAAVLTCDGGNDWGVLYDPQSAKFFDLSINGIG